MEAGERDRVGVVATKEVAILGGRRRPRWYLYYQVAAKGSSGLGAD